ncbi:MAG: glycoside hydrolase family 15 protein [Polyangiaceae bacterium]
MPSRIEDYALIGDCRTAALVARDGSMDWLCLPRFDSGACFAALLGSDENGRWQIAPVGGHRAKRRRYLHGTLILETDFESPDGAVTVIDFMPPRTRTPVVMRIVVGRRGQVAMRTEIVLRFDHGSIVPWVRRADGGIRAVAGPEAVLISTPVALRGQGLTTTAEFTVGEGERIPFSLAWHPSYEDPPEPLDPERALEACEKFWRDWSCRCEPSGPYHEAVTRSLITLKALTYDPTGGVVAAATTSLPEQIGGVRNWDYRYCWLRDATFTLYALLSSGYRDEAEAFRNWLLRAVAGDPAKLQIMYGILGERRLTELELPWLSGYEASAPVRIGNAASHQRQWDVYGELLDTMYQCRRLGLTADGPGWCLERALLNFLEKAWMEPDSGIWEVRGPPQHFTHSKVMAWVAVDRAVKSVERFGVQGPLERWRALRKEIFEQVCARGYDATLGTFVQAYGSRQLDASSLLIPIVGFLPATDKRVRGTVEAISRSLVRDGFVQRYSTETTADGLPPGEGAFLACSFWLCDCLSTVGRREEATRLFERLLALQNDVGLLSEEYDPRAGRMLGNFPQAFSHVGLVNTARNLGAKLGPAEHRRRS